MKLILCIAFASLSPFAFAESTWSESGEVATMHGNIHFRIAGKGEPLLLLHGYMGYGEQWQMFLSELSDHYTVIAPDLPGHGQSDTLGETFSFTEAAEALWVLIDNLGYNTIRGIGYSAGGMTLLRMTLMQPERMDGMVLAASAYTAIETSEEEEVSFAELPESFQQDMIRNHSGDINKITALLEAEFASDMAARDFSKVGTPTLLVAGDRDETFPIEIVVDTYRALPQSSLWIVPNLGHELFWPWGGSPKLAERFPDQVLQFFSAD